MPSSETFFSPPISFRLPLFLSQRCPQDLTQGHRKLENRKSRKDKDEEEEESEGEDDDDEDDSDDDYDGPYYKMVIGARVDLGLSPGKLAAQVAHAAVDLYKAMLSDHRPLLDAWVPLSPSLFPSPDPLHI